MKKITHIIGSSVIGIGLFACALEESNSANTNSIERDVVKVEVIKKEKILSDSPMCKLHFQFNSGFEQKVVAKIESYQVLGAKKLTFGMTGEKSIKPNSRSRISPIKTKGACKDVENIAVERVKCNLVSEKKIILGSCADKLELTSNDLITFIDKRN